MKYSSGQKVVVVQQQFEQFGWGCGAFEIFEAIVHREYTDTVAISPRPDSPVLMVPYNSVYASKQDALKALILKGEQALETARSDVQGFETLLADFHQQLDACSG